MSERIEFTEEQLGEMGEMYRRGKSGPEIAERFGVDDNTVYRRLEERGQKTRSHNHYERVERDIQDPWEDANAAYTFGVLIGDASLECDSSNHNITPKGIELDTPDKEFVVVFSKAVESAFGLQTSRRSGGKGDTRTRTFSVDLGRSYNRFKWRTETWRVPEEFLDAPEEIRIALCQSKFDSDGSVQGKLMALRSIHKPGLEDMLKIVRSLGLKGKIYGPEPREGNRKDMYRLRIPKCPSNLVRLPRKRKALKEAQE